MSKIRFILLFLVFFSLTNGLFAQAINTSRKEAHDVLLSGNLRKAIKHYSELLLVNANNAEYNAMIAYAYLNSNIDKAKAVEHYETAVKHHYSDPYVYYDMGRAYMLCYRFDEAIACFKKFSEKISKVDEGDLPAERWIEMCENAKMLMPLRANVKIENVGKSINSEFPDYNAFIDENESTIFFTTKRDKNSPAVEDVDGFKTADIYFAPFNGKQWDKPKRLPNTVNSAYIEELVGVTADANALFIYINNLSGIDDIFVSEKKKKNYQHSEGLFGINSEFIEGGAMMSPDSAWLFFSSNRPGGFGGLDIYYSKKLPNGEWSFPVNAGNLINTEYDDNFPYIAPDGKSFYFASKGHNSMGGYDLFVSQWDAEYLSFAAPENLGFPINTPDDNKTISVSKSGRYAYISDFRENSIGDLDIYKVTFLDVTPPNYIVHAQLMGEDSAAYTAEQLKEKDYKIMVKDAASKEYVGTFRPNAHNGCFSIVLNSGFYIFEFYINGNKNQAFEYLIEDREPVWENLHFNLIPKP